MVEHSSPPSPSLTFTDLTLDEAAHVEEQPIWPPPGAQLVVRWTPSPNPGGDDDSTDSVSTTYGPRHRLDSTDINPEALPAGQGISTANGSSQHLRMKLFQFEVVFDRYTERVFNPFQYLIEDEEDLLHAHLDFFTLDTIAMMQKTHVYCGGVLVVVEGVGTVNAELQPFERKFRAQNTCTSEFFFVVPWYMDFDTLAAYFTSFTQYSNYEFEVTRYRLIVFVYQNGEEHARLSRFEFRHVDGLFSFDSFAYYEFDNTFESQLTPRLMWPDAFDHREQTRCIGSWDRPVYTPQSGVSDLLKLYHKKAGESSPPKKKFAKLIGKTPEELDLKHKEDRKSIAKKRDAKAQKNKYVPQAFDLGSLFKVGMTPEVHGTLDQLSNLGNKFTEQLPDLKHLLDQIKGEGLNVNIGLDTNMLHVPGLVGLFSVAYMAYREGGNWRIALATYAAGYAGSCIYQHREWVLQKFTEIFSRFDQVRPQSFDVHDLESLAGVICGYLTMTHVRKAPNSLLASFQGLGSFDRTKTGIASALQFAIASVTKIVNWFREQVLGLSAVTLIESTIPELIAWTDKVDMVAEEAHQGLLTVNLANSQRLHALKMEGNQLSTKKMSASDSAQVRNSLGIYLATLKKLTAPFDNASFNGGGARMEPVVILISGASGVGKTWAMLPILLSVLRRVMPPEDIKGLNKDYMEHIFSRFSESEYWEGYRGQFACLFDDFGQARDVAGQPDNEYLELIRAGNIFPYILHMAGIEMKGNTHFNSRLIMCTSNTLEFNPNSIVEREAVMRRFDVVLTCLPKVKYCTPETKDGPNHQRRLDKTLPTYGVLNEDLYEFQLREVVAGKVTENILQILSFSEVVDMIVHKYQKANDRAEGYLHSLKKYVEIDPVKPQSGVEPEAPVPPPKPWRQPLPRGSSLPTGSVLMNTLDDFNSEFDISRVTPRSSSLTLDELLNKERTEVKRVMKVPEFNQWLKDKIESQQVQRRLFHLGNVKPDWLFGAYQVYIQHPQAFMECVETRPDDLAEIINTVAPDCSPIVYLDNKELGALRKARGVLSSYWQGLLDRLKNFQENHAWIKEWSRMLLICSGLALGAGLLLKGSVKAYKHFSTDAWTKHLEKLKDNPEIHPVEELLMATTAKTPKKIPYKEMPNYEPSDPEDPNLKVYFSEHPSPPWLKDPLAFTDEALKFGTYDEFVTAHPQSGNLRERKMKFTTTQTKEVKVAPQAGDTNATAMLHKAMAKSHYELSIPECGKVFGFITFLRGRSALMPKHFTTQLKVMIDRNVIEPNSDLRITNLINKRDYVFKVRDILDNVITTPGLTRQDAVVVHFPLPLWQHPEIVSYFCTEKQLAPFHRLSLSVVRLTLGVDGPGIEKNFVAGLLQKGTFVESPEIGDYTIQSVVKYNMETFPGDCGMIISANVPGFGPGKFIGFHVAGSSDRHGIGSVITSDLIHEALKGVTDFPPPINDVASPQCCEMPVPGHFVRLGTAPAPINQPGKSQITHSAFHNMWHESQFDLPCLRPKMVEGKLVDPLVNAIARYGEDPKPQDTRALRIAADYFGSKVIEAASLDGPYEHRNLSFEEAVLGIPGMKYCKAMPRTTSAGYPHVVDPKVGFRGKEWFFGQGDEYDLDRPQAQELKKDVQHIISEAREGRRVETVYVDFLKDEVRKKKRVREGHTRLISAAPLAYTIAWRMYCYMFVVALMQFNLMIGTAMGLNPYSEDWHTLHFELKAKGNNCMAGDMKNFDTSHSAYVLYLVLDIMNKFYGGRDALIRTTLMTDCAESIHVFKDIIYAWKSGGFPSGHGGTASFASIICQITHIACYIKCHPHGAAGLYDYHEHVKLVVLGDDSILSVSDWAIKFFNYHTIKAAMAELGYEYTDEMKQSEDDSPPSRPLETLTFLKRGFRYEASINRWLAPLRMEALIESLYWTQAGPRGDEISRDKVDTALRELSLHSQQDFHTWAPLVVEAAREKLNYYPIITDYQALQEITCKLDNQY